MGGGANVVVVVDDGGALTTMLFADVEVPPGPVTDNVTAWVPTVLKVWVGFCSVALPPSPKVHAQLVMAPVEASLKFTANGAFPELTSALNAATGGAGSGGGLILTMIFAVPVLPPLSVAEAVIVCVPSESEFTEMELPLPRGPLMSEFQARTGWTWSSTSDAVPANITAEPVVNDAPVSGVVMPTVGGVFTVTVIVWVDEAVPPGPVTVRVTG